jgi:transcriptional regulator with XRE-family HTH domain
MEEKEEGSLGQRIFELRKASNMSQYQLAKQLDIHQKNIGKYERNEYTPSALIVRDIAKVFGVTTDYLLFGSEAGAMGGKINIKDRQLAQWIQELDNLDEETRQVVIGVLRLAIRSNKAKKLLTEF